jgi:nucleoid-associated protein YgaU
MVMPAKLPRLRISKLDATGTEVDPPIEVQYNPEEYSLNKDNNFAVQPIPGLESPLLQYVNGNVRTLDMELFFDTWDSMTPADQKTDVRTFTDQVTGLMDIDPDLHAPPILRIRWMSLKLQCVLVKATQKFIMFRPDGVPVRARMNVTFNEFLTAEEQATQTPLFSADLSKVHVVQQGETLSSIAYRFYQDSDAWRPLAISNDLDDPRALVPGQSLRVPALPFLDPETGEVVN